MAAPGVTTRSAPSRSQRAGASPTVTASTVMPSSSGYRASPTPAGPVARAAVDAVDPVVAAVAAAGRAVTSGPGAWQAATRRAAATATTDVRLRPIGGTVPACQHRPVSATATLDAVQRYLGALNAHD